MLALCDCTPIYQTHNSRSGCACEVLYLGYAGLMVQAFGEGARIAEDTGFQATRPCYALLTGSAADSAMRLAGMTPGYEVPRAAFVI